MKRLLLVLGVLSACVPEGSPPAIDTGVAAATEDTLAGEDLFALACSSCHGVDGRGGNGGPDLVGRTEGWSADRVADVVREGSGFMDPIPLGPPDAMAVSRYVVEDLGANGR